MSDISRVDKNFEVKTNIKKDDIKFYNIDEFPFKIYGIFKRDGKYRRLPEDVAKKVSEGVYASHNRTAGGRVRFVTDSSYIAISVKMDTVCKMPHMPWTGSAGFDIYSDNVFSGTFVPPFDLEDEYESLITLGENSLREITINFPLYSGVKQLYIGLQEDAVLQESTPYKNQKPVVYYGSSITQGGCASRPGMSYQEIVSRKLNIDYVNLGFSGNAKAEDEIINYIKGLEMSAFVLDYDHNAPTTEHLLNTHEKMFKAIRNENPDLPIIIMPRPKFNLTQVEQERAEIIKNTYNNAILKGDKNVYFISGRKLCSLCEDEGTVDRCHPTDFGFQSMANALCETIKNIL